MRPTGRLHIGHLFGALQNWVKLQDEYDCFYMVADWHALMSEYADTRKLKRDTLSIIAEWLASGINPEKSTIFIQSDIHEHAELHLILSTIVPLGWLERCPTYKEALREVAGRDLTTYGFLGYPVLQASDIILYKAESVPVGEDQLPHLELTREIVRRFNSFFGNIFPEPQAKLTPASRILGLDNRKMSKSYGNVIELVDDAEKIKKKVMQMFTDPLRIRRTNIGHPENCNVCAYYKIFEPTVVKTVETECRTAQRGCTDCKAQLGEIIADFLKPVREKILQYESDEKLLLSKIEEGTLKARKVASETLREVKKAIFV